MTKEQKLEAIRAACIEANPDKEWETGDTRNWPVPARLADMLLALEDKQGQDYKLYPSYDHAGHLVIGDFKDVCWWNLRTDNLTAQSDECIDFIHSLLCV